MRSRWNLALDSRGQSTLVSGMECGSSIMMSSASSSSDSSSPSKSDSEAVFLSVPGDIIMRLASAHIEVAQRLSVAPSCAREHLPVAKVLPGALSGHHSAPGRTCVAP